jgi:hypothetical protein
MLFKLTRGERKALNTIAILIVLGVIGLWIF